MMSNVAQPPHSRRRHDIRHWLDSNNRDIKVWQCCMYFQFKWIAMIFKYLLFGKSSLWVQILDWNFLSSPTDIVTTGAGEWMVTWFGEGNSDYDIFEAGMMELLETTSCSWFEPQKNKKRYLKYFVMGSRSWLTARKLLAGAHGSLRAVKPFKLLRHLSSNKVAKSWLISLRPSDRCPGFVSHEGLLGAGFWPSPRDTKVTVKVCRPWSDESQWVHCAITMAQGWHVVE